jgi:hypothetical protein
MIVLRKDQFVSKEGFLLDESSLKEGVRLVQSKYKGQKLGNNEKIFLVFALMDQSWP